MYSNQTQNTPFAWRAPSLLVCSVASFLLEEHRKQEGGEGGGEPQADIFKHATEPATEAVTNSEKGKSRWGSWRASVMTLE